MNDIEDLKSREDVMVLKDLQEKKKNIEQPILTDLN